MTKRLTRSTTKKMSQLPLSEKSLIIGYATLKSDLTKRELYFSLAHKFIYILEQAHWNFKSISDLNEFSFLISSIDQAKCTQISIQNKKIQPLLKIISTIQFQKLSILNLNDDNIETIQDLSFINCPNLTSINLFFNNITSFKPLIKTSFKRLKILCLQKNKFRQMQVSRLHSNTNTLFDFRLLNSSAWFSGNSEDETMIQDIASLFMKIQNSQVQEYVLDQLDYFKSVGHIRRYIYQYEMVKKIFEKFQYGQLDRNKIRYKVSTTRIPRMSAPVTTGVKRKRR